MEKIKNSNVVHALVLFVVFLLVGLVTRPPALAFPQFYGLHGVLSAPFFAAVAAWYLKRFDSVGPVFAGVALLAVLLSLMSPIMGMGFALVALVPTIAYVVLKATGFTSYGFVAAVAFGALCHPAAVLAGAVSGTYLVAGESLLVQLVMLALSVVLALFAALAVRSFGKGARCAP